MASRASSNDAVYSVSEVAKALRVSTETVRRKIAAGELNAIELGGGARKQYRILAKDLTAWLGAENARAVFGIGAGLEALRALFSALSDKEREALISEAALWARDQQSEPESSGNVLSPEAIVSRFTR